MDWNNNFERFLHQFSDWQREFINNMTAAVPFTTSSYNPLNFTETFNKTLRFQEEVVTSSLEFQALLARMSIETQKQFWEGYFNLLKKTPEKKVD
ncbi:hypothetical protein [Scytonema millei]|uniref:Thylakoid-associated protein n=1 Tax=Scytonema millei VB511283 TaxID=1245923 RepID=A0A9X5E1X0_9CYAN|nr:hypothetical protein [Scytonema millei]NHC33771.1 hypothetical protein [Scytonema millei VB511283]